MQFVTTDLIGGLGNQLFQIANTLEIFHQLNQKYPGKACRISGHTELLSAFGEK